jgi:hypothetical protein
MKRVVLEILDWAYTLVVLLISLVIFILVVIYNLFKFGPKVVYRWFKRRSQTSPGASHNR